MVMAADHKCGVAVFWAALGASPQTPGIFKAKKEDKVESEGTANV